MQIGVDFSYFDCRTARVIILFMDCVKAHFRLITRRMS
jgi:hypothetical protein